jgi:hypothetical protein
MRNIAFVLWVIGWPVALAHIHYLQCLTVGAAACKPYLIEGNAAWLFLAVWIGGAWGLWERQR